MRFRMIKFEGRDLLLDRDPGAPRPALAVEPDPSRAGAQACHRADWARRDEKSRGRGRRGWEWEARAGRRVRDRAGRVWRLINAGWAMPILFPLYLLQFLLIKNIIFQQYSLYFMFYI
jgi:hypothetical protein